MVDLKEMQKDIDEMTKALEEPAAGVDDIHTDPPGTTAPGTTAPGTDPPGTTPPPTTAPATSAPTTELPAEDPRDKELRELREKIEKLEAGPKSTKVPSTKAPSTKAPSTDPPIGEEDFLANVDLDDLTRDPKLFNQLLNAVYKKGMEGARKEMKGGVETVIRSVPDIVKNVAALQAKLAKSSEDFYKENPDLIPWHKSVGAVMEEMISENPDKKYDELLPGVADEVRRRLSLQKKADDKDKKDKPPPLPKKKGGERQPTQPDLTDLDKAMDEMDKALGLD